MGIMELKIPVLTGLYQTYSRISDISAEKWKSGVLKTWRKWKKFVVESSHRYHHRLFSHVVSHFPPAFLLLFCPFTSHSSSFSSSASSSSSSVLIETAPLFLFLLFYLCVWLLFWRNYTILWWTMSLVYNSTKILIYLKLLSQ